MSHFRRVQRGYAISLQLKLKNSLSVRPTCTYWGIHPCNTDLIKALNTTDTDTPFYCNSGPLRFLSKMSQGNRPLKLSHYNPAYLEMQKALEVAKSTGASPEVIKTIESALELDDLREEFTVKCTTSASETCANIVAETHRHDWEKVHKEGKTTWQLTPRMLSGHLEGQFLKSIASIQKAKRVLDIGMFTGNSALSIAEALPADGEVVSIDMDEYLKTLVQDLCKTSPHHKKIKIRIGKAIDIMKQMSKDGEKFDMIFLDADKSEYVDYFKIAFDENLLNPGGTIAIDNAFQHGRGYMTSVGDTPAKQFAQYLLSNPQLHKVLVPMRDGVYLIRRLSDVEGDVA